MFTPFTLALILSLFTGYQVGSESVKKDLQETKYFCSWSKNGTEKQCFDLVKDETKESK